MKEILKIGIVDDEEQKVTQIMYKLKYGFEKEPIKKNKYENYIFEVVEIDLEDEMEVVIDNIIKEKIDCLLIDYKLSSKSNFSHTGIELAKQVEKKLFDFPIFILTAYEDDLFQKEIYNAYQIFDVSRYLLETKEMIELNSKMIQQVLKYRKEKENWEKELIQLLSRAGESAEIDSRILELDSRIEKSIDGKSAIPLKMKKDLNSNKIDELIKKIDSILVEE